MFARLAVFALAVLLSGAAPAPAAFAGDAIKVISYNIQFLPGIGAVANKRKEPEYRAKRIGEEMSKFDIIGFNEIFEELPRQKVLAPIREAWGEDFHVVVAPTEGERYNGGCAIVSRLPIIASNAVVYENYSRPEKYGITADGFAAKGCVHARILRGKNAPQDDYIDVFVTHLEARDNAIRELQYPELAAFIQKHSDPARPVVVMGDMNTRGNLSQQRDPASTYHVLMNALNGARPGGGVVDVWPLLMGEANGGTSDQETADGGSRIDYVFFGNPAAPGPQLKPTAIRVNPYLDPKIVALSDHNAVEADFEWSRP